MISGNDCDQLIIIIYMVMTKINMIIILPHIMIILILYHHARGEPGQTLRHRAGQAPPRGRLGKCELSDHGESMGVNIVFYVIVIMVVNIIILFCRRTKRNIIKI